LGANNEKIGDIAELIFDRNGRVVAVVLSVGGFLGHVGKDVAVPFESLRFSDSNPSATTGAGSGMGTTTTTGAGSSTGTTATTGAGSAANTGSDTALWPKLALAEFSRQQLQNAPAFRYSAQAANGTQSGSGLQPVRALIEPQEVPPREVGAYGLVAFTSMALPSEIERHKFVCEAFKATLIPQDQLPKSIPLSEQMISYWPVRNKRSSEALALDCTFLIAQYDLKTGLDAINDADKKKTGLAQKRGPFLIAWSPAESRFKKDAVVLVVDLSSVDGQQSFLEVFKSWRQKIVDDPKLWKRGFEIDAIRLALREILDKFGPSIISLFKSS
jgi:hypothetical protein